MDQIKNDASRASVESFVLPLWLDKLRHMLGATKRAFED